MDKHVIASVATISSCFKQKFGTPRQPGLVKAAKAQVILEKEFDENCVRGLQDFSHIWLNFIFHATSEKGWKPLVRPPRLGGNRKRGIFATRSSFRPNALGQSVVELEKIETKNGRVILHINGCDLLDKTPIVDIKPYLSYVDSISTAIDGFVDSLANTTMGNQYEIEFTDDAYQQCQQASDRLNEDIQTLICQILNLDPRPAYHSSQNNIENMRVYSMKLHDFDLKWHYCENNKIKVLALTT